MYKISPYTKDRAKELGVIVKPSKSKGKKLDVFKNDKKVASVGAMGYKSYPEYLKEDGKAVADERKRLYKIRHAKDLKSGNGFYANKLLW